MASVKQLQMEDSPYKKCKDGATWTFPVFSFPHKHADI